MIATTIGSRNSFIPLSNSAAYIQKCGIKKETGAEIKQKVNLYKKQIVSESNILDSDARITERTKDGCTKIYAIAVTDTFDRKVDSKVLLFSTGEDDELSYTWVAI